MFSLPLAKLSTAQDADPNEQKFSWSHETQSLTIVFDSYSAHGSFSQLLRVMQRTQVRQLIEVERLVREGNDIIRTMQERGVELKNEQLPISAIVRCPLLAIRWQRPDKKIRRLQLKFKSSEDFDVAYHHLHQLGLRMTSANEGQNQSQTPIPSPGRASVMSQSSASTPPTHPGSVGLSCPPSRLAEISNRPYTAVAAPTRLESQIHEAVGVRPISAFVGSVSESRSSSTFHNPLSPPEYFSRPDSATSMILDFSSNTSSFPPRNPQLATNERNMHDTLERPGSAIMCNRPSTGEASLPPRRELPFQRSSEPRSSGTDSGRPLSRPTSAMMLPPPLPSRVTDLRPSSSRTANQEVEFSPLPKPTVIGDCTRQTQEVQQASKTPTQNAIIENQPQTSSSPTLSNTSPLSYKQAATNVQSNAQPLSKLDSSPQNRRQTRSSNALATSPASEATYQGFPVSKNAHISVTSAENSLAAYALQSEEGRRAALNEFIFRNLENDDFLTLVEDAETCWAKVALGMQ